MADVIRFNSLDVLLETDSLSYDGFFKIHHLSLKHRLFAGGYSDLLQRELCVRQDAVGILLYDAKLELLALVEQFRVGALYRDCSPWLLEIVAGMIDKTGESAAQVAIRESQEEAGLKVTELIPMIDYFVSPGGSSERFHLFIGKVDLADCQGGIFGLATEGEDILLHTMGIEKAQDMLLQGKINNSMTIIALQWLLLNKSVVDKKWR